ncbi:D-aminoacyl-tRNA deacylase [Jeotgalibacillus proteolyticus]|uniref:D-aminoacyl-tRNA deacylase n=1 Tax=Jeotgalibacillus proteolyticus TaxID=2082395 RepID=A0A2S5GF24_9BACL|nr:D-aminoacyl-tRNA deacylase [Jeotgalibacillus proteolyticus]PPA71515.1 D-tyrosyl-tRNA(Tyr) deacylase [Jeotgalibacillus proteolyticus]
MKVVVQRSKEAFVKVDGEIKGKIDKGLVLLVGITHEDDELAARYAADKIANLRIFEDGEGKMNHSLLDQNGQILSISQFTLYGETKKGRRPNFMNAARPEKAEPLYNRLNELFEEKGIQVEKGVFGAMMDVSLINDGPVTLIVETP